MAGTVLASNLRWLKALPLMAMVGVMAVIAVTTLANADSRSGGAREHLFDLYQRLFPADVRNHRTLGFSGDKMDVDGLCLPETPEPANGLINLLETV